MEDSSYTNKKGCISSLFNILRTLVFEILLNKKIRKNTSDPHQFRIRFYLKQDPL